MAGFGRGLFSPRPIYAIRFMARKVRVAGFLGGTDEAMRKEIAKEWKAW